VFLGKSEEEVLATSLAALGLILQTITFDAFDAAPPSIAK
jgi:hypothetical protein